MTENRSERRRRERAEAKLYRRIDQSYKQAGRVAADLLPMLERMRDESVRRGWDGVTVHVDAAIEALHDGRGIDLQQHMAAATELINQHQPPA